MKKVWLITGVSSGFGCEMTKQRSGRLCGKLHVPRYKIRH